jgi:hypothetical protein
MLPVFQCEMCFEPLVRFIHASVPSERDKYMMKRMQSLKFYNISYNHGCYLQTQRRFCTRHRVMPEPRAESFLGL